MTPANIELIGVRSVTNLIIAYMDYIWYWDSLLASLWLFTNKDVQYTIEMIDKLAIHWKDSNKEATVFHRCLFSE